MRDSGLGDAPVNLHPSARAHGTPKCVPEVPQLAEDAPEERVGSVKFQTVSVMGTTVAEAPDAVTVTAPV